MSTKINKAGRVMRWICFGLILACIVVLDCIFAPKLAEKRREERAKITQEEMEKRQEESKEQQKFVLKYLASTTGKATIYKQNGSNLEPVELVRGTRSRTKNESVTLDGEEYIQIFIKNEPYLAKAESLADSMRLAVAETVKYVRTSVTVYKDAVNPDIASFIKKGSKLEIIGYDYMDTDGNVTMYRVNCGNVTGWVYAKYLVDTKEAADAPYNEIIGNNTKGVHDIHKDRKFRYELYGGSPATLDYYPYEKPDFSEYGNTLPEHCYALYLNSEAVNNYSTYVNIIKSSIYNTVVCDIRDGAMSYKGSEVVSQYVPSTGGYLTIERYAKGIDAFKNVKNANGESIHVVGRIVLFNDSAYGKDHPEDILSGKFLSPYRRSVWEYNVKLAMEAVDLFGFDEIQFDYVRFPENVLSLSKKGTTDFKNDYDEEKAETIQNFLFYACDQIHKKNAYVSVDVFGECSSTYVAAYGQYWPAISNVVDVISSMPYVDHFGNNEAYWLKPYNTIYSWAVGAAARQKEIPTPARDRTWLTCYDTPYWKVVQKPDTEFMYAQMRALKDAGLYGGWIPWNVYSSYTYYNSYLKSAAVLDSKYKTNSK